jgi:hypothetical protein
VSYRFEAQLWRWQGDAPASWVFITLPADVAFGIRCAVQDRAKAFGSVRVTARIGATLWTTSLFPDKRSGSYLLPVKAAVRRAENLHDGDMVSVDLTVV